MTDKLIGRFTDGFIKYHEPAKHTPGPWHHAEDDYQTDAWNIGPNYGNTVCRITGHAAMIANAKANAKLIAAAPEMLLVAQHVLDGLPTLSRAVEQFMRGENTKHTETLRQTHGEWMKTIITQTQTAIAKATE